MALNWKGPQVKALMEKSSRVGVNKIMTLCVAGAKEDHPFTNRDGEAERSIRIAQAAQTQGSITRGFWGSVMNTYFKYLEQGTTAMRNKAATLYASGHFRATRQKQNKNGAPWRGGSWAPTLAPEAALHYPKLTRAIREYFMKGIS